MSENGVDEQEAGKLELRKMAVRECGQWLNRINPQLDKMQVERDYLNDGIMTLHEARLTWLERAANVLGVDVRRGVFDDPGGDKRLGLYWADVDGAIIMDEDTEHPAHEMLTLDDIYKCLTTKGEVVGNPENEEELQ